MGLLVAPLPCSTPSTDGVFKVKINCLKTVYLFVNSYIKYCYQAHKLDTNHLIDIILSIGRTGKTPIPHNQYTRNIITVEGLYIE